MSTCQFSAKENCKSPYINVHEKSSDYLLIVHMKKKISEIIGSAHFLFSIKFIHLIGLNRLHRLSISNFYKTTIQKSYNCKRGNVDLQFAFLFNFVPILHPLFGDQK